MSKRFLILSAFLVFIFIGVSFVIWAQRPPKIIDEKTAIEQALQEKKTEAVSCSVTIPSNCYLYRCNTGYIYGISLSAPGSVPLRCTDGSNLETVKEVPNPS